MLENIQGSRQLGADPKQSDEPATEGAPPEIVGQTEVAGELDRRMTRDSTVQRQSSTFARRDN